MALNEAQRTEVLAQLYHKLLGEAYEQPSTADVEEVAWWEACELDRVGSALAHAQADLKRLRAKDDPVQRGHSPGTIPPGAMADMGPTSVCTSPPKSAAATNLGQAGNDTPDFYASPGSLPESEPKRLTEGIPKK